jgi:hypothetical protein
MFGLDQNWTLRNVTTNPTDHLELLEGTVPCLAIYGSAISGFAAAATVAGNALFMALQDGGAAGATVGFDGASFTGTTGAGSASANGNAGNAGDWNLVGAVGGNATGGNGGRGGGLNLTLGAPGTGGTPLLGGAFTITGADSYTYSRLGVGTYNRANITTTSTDGLVLENATAATDGVRNQWAPRLRFRAQSYRYNAGATNETHDWIIENEPSAADAAATTSVLYFKTSRAGAAYTSPFYVSNLGNVTILGTYTGETLRSAANDATLTIQSRAFTVADSAIEMATGAWTNSTGAAVAVEIKPTWNQTGDASAIGLLLNPTVTAIGSGGYVPIEARRNGITTTPSDGLLLSNTTASLVGTTVQMSPRLRWMSHAWKSDATAGDQTQEWTASVLPATGATKTTSLWRLGNSDNGGGFTYPFTVSELGMGTLLGGLTLSACNLVTDTTTGMQIATAAAQKLGFWAHAPVVQPVAMTPQLTTITYTAPGSPDYALQNLVQNTGFGFATADEGNTALSVIANLQARVAELEARLTGCGMIAAAA